MAGFSVKATAKAELKTGYLVREEVIEASVAASCKVGDVVSISYEGTSSAVITLVSATSSSTAGSYASTDIASAVNAAKAAVSAGNLIIAQADQTMGYGHVPVENRDYRYNPAVASVATAKKIAVFRIRDISDIIVGADYTAANS